MRRLLPLLLLLPAAADEPAPDEEIPLGIEALTGYRSEYVYRGFDLANSLIELQLQAEIALAQQWLLNLGGWYGSETGSGDFEEIAAFVDLGYDAGEWNAGLEATWRSYNDLIFRDGLDVGPYVNWLPHEDWRLGAMASYDTGPEGWYGALEAEWSKPLGESSFVSVLGGASAVSDYYGRDGANDLYARLSWTYLVNRHVAFTPFLGTSLPLDSAADARLFGGLWFEVNF